MKKYIVFLLFYFCVFSLISQESNLDKKYLEDQLYFRLTYNSFDNTPTGFYHNGISFGTSFGFIKDIPFNSRRNFGLGFGLGYSYDSFNSNLLHGYSNKDIVLSINDAYDTNILNYSSIEVPLEIRWRTSTYDKYKFWRVYGGVNISYIFNSKSKYTLNETAVVINDLNILRRVQYGLSLAIGYNTWNFYANYALSSLHLSNTRLEGSRELVQLKPLRIGLMFYFF
ncbi:porin family protein [Bacteroidota bacterium]